MRFNVPRSPAVGLADEDRTVHGQEPEDIRVAEVVIEHPMNQLRPSGLIGKNTRPKNAGMWMGAGRQKAREVSSIILQHGESPVSVSIGLKESVVVFTPNALKLKFEISDARNVSL